MNRRHFISTLSLALALAHPIMAAEEAGSAEPATQAFWLAGGRKPGGVARKVEPPLERMNVEWMSYKAWGVEKSGELMYLRPGKDTFEKGTEYFFVRRQKELGLLAGRRILQLDLDASDDDKASPRALFFLLEQEPVNGAQSYAAFFYLGGAKGEKLTSVYDKEKVQLTVTAQPPGKAAARTFAFTFASGQAELMPAAGKVKAGK